MSPQNISLILLSVLAALYLPVIATSLRRWEGQETATTLLSVYMTVALMLTLLEGFHYGNRLQVETQTALDIQIYGAFVLAVLMLMTVLIFVRREVWTWLGVGVFWGLIAAAFALNISRLGDVVWTNGAVTLTPATLGPGMVCSGLGGLYRRRLCGGALSLCTIASTTITKPPELLDTRFSFDHHKRYFVGESHFDMKERRMGRKGGM